MKPLNYRKWKNLIVCAQIFFLEKHAPLTAENSSKTFWYVHNATELDSSL